MLRKRSTWIILAVVALLVVAGGAFLYSRAAPAAAQNEATQDVQTSVVRTGSITVSATGAGTVIAAQIHVPITLVFDKLIPNQFARFIGNKVRMIYAQIDEDADMDMVIQQIEYKLAKNKGVTVDELPFTIQTQDDVIETRGAATEAFRNLLAWVAGVSLLVGGIGIMNIMLVSAQRSCCHVGRQRPVAGGIFGPEYAATGRLRQRRGRAAGGDAAATVAGLSGAGQR